MEVAMINPNGRPLSRRKRAQILVLLTILAWATQTLMHQLGYGAEVDATPVAQPSDLHHPPERFVPSTPRMMRGATLALRGEATVIGEEVRLKQVCRWSDDDAAVFAPIGDLVLARLGQGMPFRSISMDEIKAMLHDAGVNLGPINFVGTTSCTVSRSDVEYDETVALRQWIEAKQGPAQPAPTTAPATEGAALVDAAVQLLPEVRAPKPQTPAPSLRTLRQMLVEDVSQRLNLPLETLQLDFKPQDEKVLYLAEPHFRFQLEAVRVRDLGQVTWNVHITADGTTQNVPIIASARAWQNQLVVARPLAHKQVIRAEDAVERRALINQLSEDLVLERGQVIGQQAARELRPGMLFTARMVDAVPLVRSGQFVTVSLNRGSVRVNTVARALEGGSYGQTIRVKNEATREILEVTLTGPQTATFGGTQATAAVDTGDAMSP
jgi:flagella basal body P-ring formation protein FlgA